MIVGSYQKETYGQQFADAGIPVYYTSEGPSIAYERGHARNRHRAGALLWLRRKWRRKSRRNLRRWKSARPRLHRQRTTAHAHDDLLQRRRAPTCRPPSGYLGSMLAMLPFENLADTVADPAARHRAHGHARHGHDAQPGSHLRHFPHRRHGRGFARDFEEDFAANPAWQQIDAVKNGNVVYGLSKEFVTTKGLQVVDSFNELMDMLEGAVPAAETARTARTAGITLEYPANMQEKGYTEPLTLTSAPRARGMHVLHAGIGPARNGRAHGGHPGQQRGGLAGRPRGLRAAIAAFAQHQL